MKLIRLVRVRTEETNSGSRRSSSGTPSGELTTARRSSSGDKVGLSYHSILLLYACCTVHYSTETENGVWVLMSHKRWGVRARGVLFLRLMFSQIVPWLRPVVFFLQSVQFKNIKIGAITVLPVEPLLHISEQVNRTYLNAMVNSSNQSVTCHDNEISRAASS